MRASKTQRGPGEHIAIVGGGVIGAMSAWYLTQAGFRVTIVERDRFGAACSHGNCGYICPSHVLPLCQPGAIGKTLRTALKRNSPFAIKPRLSADFAKWFLRFAQRCNEGDMLRTAAELHTLLQSSLALYRDLVAEHKIDCDWQERGLLFVHDSQKDFDAFARTESLLRDRFGVGATRYDADAMVELEPALLPNAAGAWHFEGDCHLRPDKLMAALRALLVASGVEIVEGTAMQSFESSGGRVRAVATATGSIEADGFVVATGAWTPLLNKHLGFSIPIEPGKGYSITTDAPAVMPSHPIVFEETHVAVTPMNGAYRIGSTMEFVGYDESIHPKRLRLLTGAAEKHLVDAAGANVQETWFGWRPMVWDGKPIIGPAPAHTNVWVAAGHSMLGLSLATGTGRLLTELIAGDEPHLAAEPFSAARFA